MNKEIYGPYTRKDNRMIVVVTKPDGSLTSMSYPKYLYQEITGYILKEDETIDHIDNDFTNNDISNLQVLTRTENAKKEVLRGLHKRKLYEFICPQCGNPAVKFYNNVLHHNFKKGNTGPYCSRSCAGKASHNKNVKSC